MDTDRITDFASRYKDMYNVETMAQEKAKKLFFKCKEKLTGGARDYFRNLKKYSIRLHKIFCPPALPSRSAWSTSL